MNKSKKGLIVIIVLLIIVALGLVGYICYEEKELSNLRKDYNTLKSENDKNASALVESESHYIPSSNGYNIYYDHGFVQIIGYKGELYLIESFDNVYVCSLELIDKEVKFVDNYHKCKNKTEYSGDSYIMKMNIKEKEVSRVIVQHIPSMNDPSYVTFVIYLDGTVKRVVHGEVYPIEELNSYDIVDIKEYACETGMKETCKNPYLSIVLRDGTTKKIDFHMGP